MKIGMIGLGRMGKNMALRLRSGGHDVVGFNQDSAPYAELRAAGVEIADDLADLAKRLPLPRAAWCMVPSGEATESVISQLGTLLSAGDIVIDGGNSNFHDSVRRGLELAGKGIEFLDAGTSGGIWGRELGFCLMVGGNESAFRTVEPAFRTLAPADGCRFVGPSGAGHYAKMVHNAIEYGMMQAYAEGFELLEASDYPYDLKELAHLWNQGSVVRSWLLELAERAFATDPHLTSLTDRVDDSGEGRWTLIESIERAVPMPVLALSLQARFRSRQESSFAGRVLAALRQQFGGHAVQAAGTSLHKDSAPAPKDPKGDPPR